MERKVAVLEAHQVEVHQVLCSLEDEAARLYRVPALLMCCPLLPGLDHSKGLQQGLVPAAGCKNSATAGSGSPTLS